MATIKDLPYELLYTIIILLVQSSGGAEDFARILSVCRKSLLFAEDEYILRHVHFDIKMDFKNFYWYQHVNSLLVKCSEVGNVAAQFLLGKVILVSSSQLLLGEWQNVECVHPCDFVRLSDLSCILATKVSTQNHDVGAFMTKFLPKQVSTCEVSKTRLVHCHLVKQFLLNASPRDCVEMVVFLWGYIWYYVTKVGNTYPFLYMRELVIIARHVVAMERPAKSKEAFIDAYISWRDYLKSWGNIGKNIYENKEEADFLLPLLRLRCRTVGMRWREAISDVDFLEEMWRNDMSNKFDEACSDFENIRVCTINSFERNFKYSD